MKEIKKFNKKSYLKHLGKSIKKMPKEDAYTMIKGVYLLWENLDDYYKNKYGSPKRLEDLGEYVNALQNSYFSYLSNVFKEEEELPY